MFLMKLLCYWLTFLKKLVDSHSNSGSTLANYLNQQKVTQWKLNPNLPKEGPQKISLF